MAQANEAGGGASTGIAPGVGATASYGGRQWKPDAVQIEAGWKVPEPSNLLHGRQADRNEGAGPSSEVIEALSHIVFAVTDLERSERWYTEFLPLDILGRNLTAEERPHTVLRTIRGELVILVQDAAVVPIRPGTMGMHHSFALTPNQYRRMVVRAKDWGYELYNLRAVRMAHGEYEVTISDPDGHSIEITTTGPEAERILFPGVGVVDCGLWQSYKVGEVRPFVEGRFFVARLREGFVALSQWCTHRNGLLAYQKAHWQFWCPFHQATYDRRGEVTGGPALMPLRLHGLRFDEAGHVLVDTDEINERECFDLAQAAKPPAAQRSSAHVARDSSGSRRKMVTAGATK